MGTITGSIGTAGGDTFFGSATYLNCTCPAGYYPTKITFNDIQAGGAYWKNGSASSKILDIHLVNSAGTPIATNIMRISLAGYGTDATTKTTSTFDGSSYVGQKIYILGGNATENIYLKNATSITVTTAAASYTLTTSAGTGGTLSASPSGSVATGTTVTLTPSASTGYTFSGYTTSPSVSISNNKFTMPASNLTVTANFTHNVYTLSKSSNPSSGGSITLGSSTGYYGSVINISATANTGYVFSSWSTTGGTIANINSASTTITMPNGNATVTANFTHVVRTLSSAVSPSGSGTVTLGSPTGYYNSTISISATPADGYAFSKWTTTGGTIANANSPSTTITMPNADATVTATFVSSIQTKTITFVSGGNGKVITPSGNYAVNNSITIEAKPDAYYTFSSWSATSGTIASSTSAITTYTVPNADATVTATFTQAKSALTFTATTGGTVSTSSGNYNVHSIVNISATPSTGYKFDRWIATDGTVADIFSSSTTFIVPDVSTVTITAYFSATSSSTSNAGRYNGTSWDSIIPSRYDGTNWVECELQRYNGSSWDTVDTQ